MGRLDYSAAVDSKDVEAKLLQARRENYSLKKELKAKEEELEALKKTSADTENQTQKIAALEAEKASLLSRIETLEANEKILKQQLIDEAKAHAEEVAEFKRIAEEAKKESADLEAEYKKDVEEKAARLEEMTQSLEEKESALARLSEEKLLLQASLDAMEASGTENAQSVETYRLAVESAEKREADLKSIIDSYEKQVKEYATQLANSTIQLLAVKEEVAKLNEANQTLTDKNAELLKRERTANLLRGNYKRTWEIQKRKTQEAEAKVEATEAKLKEVEAKAKKLAEQLQRTTDLLAKKDEDVARLKEYYESEIKRLHEEIAEKDAKIKEQEKTIAQKQAEIEEKDAEIAAQTSKIQEKTEKSQGDAHLIYDLERSKARAGTRVQTEIAARKQAEGERDDARVANAVLTAERDDAVAGKKQAEQIVVELQTEVNRLLEEIGATSGGDFNIEDAVHRLIMTKFAEQYSEIKLDEKKNWAIKLYRAVESAKKADKKYQANREALVAPEAGYEKIVDEIVLSYPLILEKANEKSIKEFENIYPTLSVGGEVRKVVEDMIVKNMRKPKFFDEKGVLKAGALAALVLTLGSTGVYYGIADPQIQTENKAKRIEEQRTVITAIVKDFENTESTAESAVIYHETYGEVEDKGSVVAMSETDASEYATSYKNIQEASELVNSIVELDENGAIIDSCLLGTAFINYQNAVESNNQEEMTLYASEIAEYQEDIATCVTTVQEDFNNMITLTGYDYKALIEAYNEAIEENKSYETRDITVENTTDNAYQEFIEAFSSGKGTLKNIVVNYQASNGLVTITYDVRGLDGKLSTNNVATCTVTTGVANNNAVLALACQQLGIEATIEVDSESEI